MFRRSILTLLVPAVALVLTLASAAPALAGGPPSFSFESPAGSGERTASSPVLIVHAYSCHAPTDAQVTARAEGLVNGQHRSIPLKLNGTGRTGVYEVARQWPAEGSWVLVFSVDRGGQTTALVKLDLNGAPIFSGSANAAGRELSAKYLRTMSGKATTGDIDAVLTAQVAK